MLYDSLGSHSYAITTKVPEAQRWFDQGLRLVYAFNHAEAQRAFREAARLDPACAMCFWGVAITEGSNYNSPTDPDREKRALAAVRQAQQHAAAARPSQRALIDGARQAPRRPTPAPPGAKTLDRAYADAMREAARQFPDDLEVGDVLRRRDDESQTVEPLGGRRHAASGNRGAGEDARARARPGS